MSPIPVFRAQNRSRRLSARRAIVCAALLGCAGAAAAQGLFGERPEDPDNPWQEEAVQLPPPPQQEDLLPFYVSGNATQSFAVDSKSLTVGADGVVRYTLVSTSSAGARNVSYEGIRCRTREVKQYAYGRSDGSWAPVRRDKWELIRGTPANRYHAVLAKEYFCDDRAMRGKVEEVRYLLRNQAFTTPY